jgi:putative membrane protein
MLRPARGGAHICLSSGSARWDRRQAAQSPQTTSDAVKHRTGTDYNQPMRYWLIHWLLSGVALLIVARIVPGIQVDGFGAALIAALVIGLVGATVGLLLKIVLLPVIVLTLGLVYFLINGLMLKLASAVVPGFRVNGCLPAVLGSVLLSIVDYILIRLAGV